MGKPKSCATCLWCWPEIHGDGTRRCYAAGSPAYHQIPAHVCAKYEVQASGNIKLYPSCWGNPGREYRKSRKGVQE